MTTVIHSEQEQKNFALRIGDFEGPIELLLRLIEQRKLAINDVSLASVTDEYIRYIQQGRVRDYSYITHFIYIAATLVLIKSKSLLPNIELAEEEQESVSDLKLRLALYRIYQDQSIHIKKILHKDKMFARPFQIKRVIVFSPDPITMQVHTFPELLAGVLGQVPQEEKLTEVRVRTALHIDEMIRNLDIRIRSAISLSFNEFSKAPLADATPKEQRVYTIVSFLALLEMARNGIIQVLQTAQFQDITINKSPTLD